MSDDQWAEPPPAEPPAAEAGPGHDLVEPVAGAEILTRPAPGATLPTDAAGWPAVTAPRRDARVGAPPRHQQWLVNQLPVGMLQTDFFVRFVSIFQELGETLMQDADLLEHVPDLTVSPTPMLSALAGWIGVDAVDQSLPDHLQRLILASSARALARRGTARGLREYLAMLSGAPAEVTDGGGIWAEGEAPADVGWLRMNIQGTGHLSEDEFVAMIRDEIPAHVRAELWIGDRRVLNTAEEDR
ncbi:phage tail protein [Nakamurella lactea]|uniref:phage tail protein n=1 Tax=Nakamurella lactea TaxID=459515 RepID=UPI0004101C75|nr:phage tail protein [Nakamurella lactea]